jgi:hypothetical protein
MGVPKFATLGLLWLWGPITSCANLWLKWGLKQSYSPRWEISKDMSHATCTQVNRGDSQLLVVGNQTANLTPDLSFGHNLCFKCSNGWCEPILDIYVSIAFQWYKKILNLMGFDPYNHSLKIQEYTGTPTPQVGVALGVWGFILSHSPTLPRVRCVSRASLLFRVLASPCLGREPKVKVVTPCIALKWWLK